MRHKTEQIVLNLASQWSHFECSKYLADNLYSMFCVDIAGNWIFRFDFPIFAARTVLRLKVSAITAVTPLIFLIISVAQKRDNLFVVMSQISDICKESDVPSRITHYKPRLPGHLHTSRLLVNRTDLRTFLGNWGYGLGLFTLTDTLGGRK